MWYTTGWLDYFSKCVCSLAVTRISLDHVWRRCEWRVRKGALTCVVMSIYTVTACRIVDTFQRPRPAMATGLSVSLSLSFSFYRARASANQLVYNFHPLGFRKMPSNTPVSRFALIKIEGLKLLSMTLEGTRLRTCDALNFYLRYKILNCKGQFHFFFFNYFV